MTVRGENESGPNYLGYYKHMVLKLLSGKDEFLLPFSDTEPLAKCSEGGEGNFFADGMVTGVSEFQRERLKGFLDQSISALTHDTDEVVEWILAKIEIQSALKDKGVSAFDDSPSNRDGVNQRSQSFSKVYNDFQGFLNDGLCPEEALEECATSISKKLGIMQHNLEELLYAAMSRCRTMTRSEKQQLGQRILKLPVKALDRVAEIVQNKNHPAEDLQIYNVNLEDEDDATLWRLYAYVESVRKAKGMKSPIIEA